MTHSPDPSSKFLTPKFRCLWHLPWMCHSQQCKRMMCPQQVYHCPFAEWMAAPQGERAMSAFVPSCIPRSLKAWHLIGGSHEMLFVGRKAGREEGETKKSQEYLCLSNFGWHSRDRLVFLHQFHFPAEHISWLPFPASSLLGEAAWLRMKGDTHWGDMWHFQAWLLKTSHRVFVLLCPFEWLLTSYQVCSERHWGPGR